MKARGPIPGHGALLQVKEETRSTMEDAFELARSGGPSGSVAVAGYQSVGRGRVPGRTWVSAPWQSLLATIVLRTGDLPFPLSQLPLRVGVAAARAVEEAAGLDVRIKWPNDLMVGRRKLAGILCETRGDVALVGIGVNCTQESWPPELAQSACSIVQASGRSVDLPSLLAILLRSVRDSLGDGLWLEKLRRTIVRGGRTGPRGSDRIGPSYRWAAAGRGGGRPTGGGAGGRDPGARGAGRDQSRSMSCQPRAWAIRRSLQSGFTATGLPTASSKGRS